MKAARALARVLIVGCVCSLPSHAEKAKGVNGGESSKEPYVTIELAKLEVTDSSLGLSCRIRNSSDHDVWVCREVSSLPFEVYLSHDTKTLLIRKRLDVPCHTRWSRPPAAGKYVRLSPGTAEPESFLIDLPATPQVVYASPGTETVSCTVRRLVLEIGYYDEDLPALVRSILEVAENFNPTSKSLKPEIWTTYFRGLLVRNSLAAFDVMNKDPESSGHVYIDYSSQALAGEKILHIEINGVSIPYSGPVKQEGEE